MRAGESNCFRDYRRLGEIAKLATTYQVGAEGVKASAGEVKDALHAEDKLQACCH
jgi:hypothetical protein